MLAFLDIQHLGRRSREGDLGAGPVDVDGDGQAEAHEREALLTPVYAANASQQLYALGHDSVLLTGCEYVERHAGALRLLRRGQSGAYLACHLNAGGGSYGLVLYLPGHPRAQRLAEHIATTLAMLPELSTVRTEAIAGAWSRAEPTLAGLRGHDDVLPGVCLEPAFLDQPAHRPLLDNAGLARIGRAIATGVDRWSRQPS